MRQDRLVDSYNIIEDSTVYYNTSFHVNSHYSSLTEAQKPKSFFVTVDAPSMRRVGCGPVTMLVQVLIYYSDFTSTDYSVC